MKYMVYSDGSASKDMHKIGFSFIITGDNTFITQKNFSTDGSNILSAEILGIGMAAEYLLNNRELNMEDSVKFCVDSKPATQYILTRLEGVKVTEDNLEGIRLTNPEAQIGDFVKLDIDQCAEKRVKVALSKIAQLKDKSQIEFSKSWGHSRGLNGNSVADKYAKYALRLNRR